MKVLLISGVVVLIASSAYADKAGDRLLAKCARTMYSLRSLQADFSVRFEPGASDYDHAGIVKLKKPRQVIMRYSLSTGKEYVIVERGKWQTVYNSENNNLGRYKSPWFAWRNDWSFGNAFGSFYDREALYVYAPAGSKRSITGTIRVGNALCKVLTITKNPDYVLNQYYIASDGTLRGHVWVSRDSNQIVKATALLTKVKVNASIPEKAFAWTPPADAKQ